MTVENLMMAAGLGALLLTIQFTRHRQMRAKYTLGWLVTAGLLATVGAFPDMFKEVAQFLHLSFTSAILLLALSFMYLFGMSSSISATKHEKHIDTLAQEIAILKNRVDEQEEKLNETLS